MVALASSPGSQLLFIITDTLYYNAANGGNKEILNACKVTKSHSCTA